MTRRAGGAFGTTVMCQCCQDSETCFRAGHAVDGPGNVQCISREAMCGAMSIYVAAVPRGIRGNLIPCHWEIPTAQDGRKARHGEVEAKRDGHLRSKRLFGVVSCLESGCNGEFPDCLQWIPCKPTAGVVHHRGSRRRWGSFGRESSRIRIYGSRMKFQYISTQAKN